MDDKAQLTDPASQARALLKRPLRILLCPDQPNWAFDHIANNIIRFAPDYLDIRKYFMMSGRNRDLTRLYQVIASEQIDLVHLFWREDLFEFLRPETMLSAAHQMGVDFTDIVEIIGTRALTTSVYDHLHLSQEALFERTTSFHLIDAYSVSSRKLQNIYASAPDLPPPDCVITDGVDLDLFYPGDQVQCERVQPVIGWVGNSKWGKHQGGDPKGYHRLFTPALEYLKNAGVPAIAKVADPQVKHIPFSEMPQFYRRIDILACTSSMEGTPNPVLEAMACGVPVVSTDVGIVPELFGPLQSRYILKNPDPEAFALSLKNILTNENEYQALCMENRERISNWSWQKRVEPWWPFWLSACEQARKPRLARRRAFALAQDCMRYMHSSDPRPRPGFANDFFRRILDIG
tara:strand:+ start:146988 stop:148202 length:1215 start_codon:yes stop_codon:yes gene_type:complete